MSDRGLDLLTRRCAALPAVLDDALARPLPTGDPSLVARRWCVTATGASEGPARVFAAALRGVGVCASFVPLSRFAGEVDGRDDVLALFSQGVSPNARMALAATPRFARSFVVTAATGDPAVARAVSRGTVVLSHGPDVEGELLLRVQGPAAATVLALRWVDAIARDAGREGLAPWRPTWSAADDGGLDLDDAPLAFVTTGDPEYHHGLRWKFLEGVGHCDPPMWDVLQFAHGPLQHVVGRRATLVSLEHAGDVTAARLVDRLASTLDPALHRLVRWRADAPAPWSSLAFDLRANAQVLAAMRRGTRDLACWPGRHLDGALYDLDGAAALATKATP